MVTRQKFILSYFVSTIISTILANYILKNIFRTPRPFADALQVPPLYPTDFSFPSGHATFAFASAYVFTYYDKKRAPLYYFLAVLVAFSRVYFGYHYVHDVVAGAIIGALVSQMVVYFVEYDKTKRGST